MKLKKRRNGDVIIYHDKKSDSNLYLGSENSGKLCLVNLEYGISEKEFGPGPVTCRDIEHYKSMCHPLPFDPNLKYVEVGAGLGELTPYLVKNLDLKHKPIVIDPVDYNVMLEMLSHALGDGLGEPYESRLHDLIDRCNIISDPRKVELVNTTLEDAVDSGLIQKGIADVTVDVCGAYLYGERERTKSLLRYLTKEGGIIPKVDTKKGALRKENE